MSDKKVNEENEMVWFALFPHPDCKYLVVECDGGKPDPHFYLNDNLKDYMDANEPFTVRFVRHRRKWIKQFPDL